MDDVGRNLTFAAVAAGILLTAAFFSACYTSVRELGENKAAKLAENNRGAARIAKMLEDRPRFAAVNTFWRLFLGAGLCSVCLKCFYSPVKEWLSALGANVSAWASAVLVAGLGCLVYTVFGVGITSRLAACGRIGEGFALKTSGVYKAWLMIFVPGGALADGICRGVLALMGVDSSAAEESVTEEEILMMLDAGNETGTIEESQAEMISNIFEFDDISIGDIMTHRTEVEALEENAPIRDAVELAIESGFSRIPVYHETIDDICGVIYAKDLLTLVFHESAQDRVVRDFMREVLFAPETQKCGELFKELTRNKVQLAVAVDEYGGTAGVVTLEDLLETIVGNIQDEYDDETDQVVQLEDGSFEMQGNADYEEAMELMGAEAEEDTQFETVAGMISEELGRVPEDGETPEVSWKGFRFKVLKVCDRRIERVRAEKIQVSQE